MAISTCQRCGATRTEKPTRAARRRYCSRACQRAAYVDARPLAERFWSRVEKADGEACWLWKGARRGEYGALQTEGRMEGAHRVSYEINVGPIPEGMEVCHHCDNPPCVRPDHLFLGTTTDNRRDACRKGRARGQPSPEINRSGTHRQCCTCHIVKAITAFSPGNRRCRECRNRKARERSAA